MILLCLFIGFLFSLVKKLYQKYINKSKTAKTVLFFQIILAIFLTYLIGYNYSLISVLILLFFLFHIFIVDINKYLIPYSSIIFLLIYGITSIIQDLFFNVNFIYCLDLVKDRLIGFLIFIIIWITLTIIQNKLKKEFLGGGDLMLFCVFSLIIGYKYTIICLFISSVIALIIYPFLKKKLLPYGPFLVIGFIIIMIISFF